MRRLFWVFFFFSLIGCSSIIPQPIAYKGKFKSELSPNIDIRINKDFPYCGAYTQTNSRPLTNSDALAKEDFTMWLYLQKEPYRGVIISKEELDEWGSYYRQFYVVLKTVLNSIKMT